MFFEDDPEKEIKAIKCRLFRHEIASCIGFVFFCFLSIVVFLFSIKIGENVQMVVGKPNEHTIVINVELLKYGFENETIPSIFCIHSLSSGKIGECGLVNTTIINDNIYKQYEMSSDQLFDGYIWFNFWFAEETTQYILCRFEMHQKGNKDNLHIPFATDKASIVLFDYIEYSGKHLYTYTTYPIWERSGGNGDFVISKTKSYHLKYY